MRTYQTIQVYIKFYLRVLSAVLTITHEKRALFIQNVLRQTIAYRRNQVLRFDNHDSQCQTPFSDQGKLKY